MGACPHVHLSHDRQAHHKTLKHVFRMTLTCFSPFARRRAEQATARRLARRLRAALKKEKKRKGVWGLAPTSTSLMTAMHINPRPALPRPAAHAHAVPALRQVSAELVDRAEGARGKGRDAIPMRGTSRMLAPSRTEYRSEHCARVSPAAWRDPQAERLLFFGGVVPCAVIERHPKLTAGVPPRERRTHTSLTYIWRRAEATPHLQRDGRSGSRGRP